MTKTEILNLVAECENEKAKTQIVPHFYKRNGKMVERSYPDVIHTQRYEELFYDREKKFLRSENAKIFKCGCCGRKIGYFELENWACNFDEDDYICSDCYEEGMGEDL